MSQNGGSIASIYSNSYRDSDDRPSLFQASTPQLRHNHFDQLEVNAGFYHVLDLVLFLLDFKIALLGHPLTPSMFLPFHPGSMEFYPEF